MRYLKQFMTRFTPQSEPIPGSTQVANNAGGPRYYLLNESGQEYYGGTWID